MRSRIVGAAAPFYCSAGTGAFLPVESRRSTTDGHDELKLSRRTLLGATAVAGVLGTLMAAVPASGEETGVVTGPAPSLAKLPSVEVELTTPPFVHPHHQVAIGGPKVVHSLAIEEKQLVIDEYGATGPAMTFNGSVPGPLMVVHQNDYVEPTMINTDTK